MTCRPFISYAKEDREVAERLYGDLRDLGADPWLDVHQLRGGESWKESIRNALRNSTHVLTLISVSSVAKTGFVQSEVRQALELLDNVPPGRVFIVPVRLDDSKPQHEKLNELQWIDLFPDYATGFARIAVSLDLVPQSSSESKLSPGWFTSVVLMLVVTVGLSLGTAYILRRPVEPDVISDRRVLRPDGQRGSSAAIPVSVPVNANIILHLALGPSPTFPNYRVEMLDLSETPPRSVWTRSGIRIGEDGAFTMTIPNAYLHVGSYQLVVSGEDGARRERLASYTLKATR
ncbi:MAG TPA: toll/interleukin-1 receptor domain-containing protein [Thermoanaerobaculia bacterium]|nr:toll/interleukin-1 receptor domain-containing protein [Thermoanaerobaculia bacterium]